MLIDKNGSCFICECSGWLPLSVGNLQLQTIEEIFRSERCKEIRKSIVQGTYEHCKENLCSYLSKGKDYDKNQKWHTTVPKVQLRQIRLGHDNSCNLACPSCRISKIFESRGIKFRNRLKLNKKIFDFLKNYAEPINIHIGSDGDPFASLVYRNFLKNCPVQKNITFTLQTNGLLIKKMYERNKFIFSNLRKIGISVDGCTKTVYEKLRRGGKFNILLENLIFLRQLKYKYNFEIYFHCVLQKENYQQIEQYIDFSKTHGADKIYFNRIVDWKTLKDFDSYDVVSPMHPEHNKFICEIKKIDRHRYARGKGLVEIPTLEKYL